MLPLPVPYAAASLAQRQQALSSAHQVLHAAFPHLSQAQWIAALDQVQPPLLVLGNQPAQLTHDGLAALVCHLAPLAAGAVAPPAPPRPAAPRLPPPVRGTKQTYAVPDDLREELANVSYWQRIPLSRLVVLGLRQLTAQYPDDAKRPRPRDDSPPAA